MQTDDDDPGDDARQIATKAYQDALESLDVQVFDMGNGYAVPMNKEARLAMKPLLSVLKAERVTAEAERDQARRIATNAYQDDQAADRVYEEAKRLLTQAYEAHPLDDEEANEDRWLAAVGNLAKAAQGERPFVPWDEVRADLSARDALEAARAENARLKRELELAHARNAMACENACGDCAGCTTAHEHGGNPEALVAAHTPESED